MKNKVAVYSLLFVLLGGVSSGIWGMHNNGGSADMFGAGGIVVPGDNVVHEGDTYFNVPSYEITQTSSRTTPKGSPKLSPRDSDENLSKKTENARFKIAAENEEEIKKLKETNAALEVEKEEQLKEFGEFQKRESELTQQMSKFEAEKKELSKAVSTLYVFTDKGEKNPGAWGRNVDAISADDANKIAKKHNTGVDALLEQLTKKDDELSETKESLHTSNTEAATLVKLLFGCCTLMDIKWEAEDEAKFCNGTMEFKNIRAEDLQEELEGAKKSLESEKGLGTTYGTAIAGVNAEKQKLEKEVADQKAKLLQVLKNVGTLLGMDLNNRADEQLLNGGVKLENLLAVELQNQLNDQAQDLATKYGNMTMAMAVIAFKDGKLTDAERDNLKQEFNLNDQMINYLLNLFSGQKNKFNKQSTGAKIEALNDKEELLNAAFAWKYTMASAQKHFKEHKNKYIGVTVFAAFVTVFAYLFNDHCWNEIVTVIKSPLSGTSHISA